MGSGRLGHRRSLELQPSNQEISSPFPNLRRPIGKLPAGRPRTRKIFSRAIRFAHSKGRYARWGGDPFWAEGNLTRRPRQVGARTRRLLLMQSDQLPIAPVRNWAAAGVE